MNRTVPRRGDVAPDDTWDLASVYPSDDAWAQEYAAVSAELPQLAAFGGQLGTGPDRLAAWFDQSERLTQRVMRLSLYARMSHNVETTNQAAVARLDQAVGLATQLQAALAFAEPELLAIDADQLRAWLEQDDRLAPYAHAVDRLRQRQAHVRSAEVEELLSQVGDPFASATRIHGTLTDADLRFAPAHTANGDEIEIMQGNYNRLLTDPDRDVRRSAWEHYADAHLANKNTIANCLATGVKQHVFTARARRYGSSLEAALGPNHIPTAVFHNLIDTYKRHLPTWHRYWQVRRQALGYDALHVYDIKAPLTAHQPDVSFDQSIEWVVQGMQPLGDEYAAILQDGLQEQRWVDRYPNQGKRAGAYSSGVYGTHPFILMSYNDDLFSMSTLAHETGHSMHSYLTRQTQPFVYANYGLFVAETASNFNQALVRAKLLADNTAPDFQIAVIEEAMANFHRYFFIMPTLARFELEIHERVERGEGLTADSMIALMNDLFAEGYGTEVVPDPERVGSTWMHFATHMYSNFYVYQYATGISAAHALAEGVLADRPNAVNNYLAFLRAGSSLYPLDALKLAGVDMTTPEPVEHTFGVLASYVDRLATLTAGRTVSA